MRRLNSLRGKRSASGGSASMQAVTRVNSEQASKVKMRVPTGLRYREGRCVVGKQPTFAPATTAGVVETACGQRHGAQRGRSLHDEGKLRPRTVESHRSAVMSDRLIVVLKRRNGRGAKGPDFGVLAKASQGRGLA